MVWKMGEGDPYILISELLGGPLPSMARGEYGKPLFQGRAEKFSVSRSGGLALCAVGAREVGCDIERLRPRSGGLPRYALGEQEFRWYADRGSRWEDFYSLWTLKEAKVKCTGRGLVPPVREIAVPPLEPGESAVLDGFAFTALGGEFWRGAICEALKKPPVQGEESVL